MTFKRACAKYTNRFTMEHVPEWAKWPTAPNGKFYAPQYRSDKEWFDNTKFPPDPACFKTDCHSTNQTWPLGRWLDHRF